MSKIKNNGLEQYGAEPFEQQQFGTDGIEGVNVMITQTWLSLTCVPVFAGVWKDI